MYVLFTAIPLVGHINPLLRQAEELQRRGCRVAFASTANMAAHVAAEAPDVPFVDLGAPDAGGERVRQDQAAASVGRSFARGALRMVRGLTALWPVMFDGLAKAIAADRPDVAVVDLFTAAGVCAADAAGVPVVIHNADLLASISVRLLPPADHLPMLFSGRSRHEVGPLDRAAAPLLRHLAAAAASLTVGRDLNRARRSRGLPPVDIHERLRGRTTIVMGAFGLEYERPLPPNIVMAGAMLPPPGLPLAGLPLGGLVPAGMGAMLPLEMDRWLSDGPPVVYCNFGTIVAEPPHQIEKMAAAFAAQPGRRILWVLRPRDRWPAAGPQVRLIEWGPPPSSILAHPNVRVFVSHCGINSVLESILAGTPIVGIPMFADQRDMAVRVSDAGAGVWLDKYSFTPAALAGAIDRVAANQSFTAALPALQRAITEAGGVRRAADLIIAASRTASRSSS